MDWASPASSLRPRGKFRSFRFSKEIINKARKKPRSERNCFNGIIRSSFLPIHSQISHVFTKIFIRDDCAQGNWKHALNSNTKHLETHLKIRCCRKGKKSEVKNYEFKKEIVERRITNPEKRLPVLSHTSKFSFYALVRFSFLLLVSFFGFVISSTDHVCVVFVSGERELCLRGKLTDENSKF